MNALRLVGSLLARPTEPLPDVRMCWPVGRGACAVGCLMTVTGLTQREVVSATGPQAADRGMYMYEQCFALAKLGFAWRPVVSLDWARVRRHRMIIGRDQHAVVWCPEREAVFDVLERGPVALDDSYLRRRWSERPASGIAGIAVLGGLS